MSKTERDPAEVPDKQRKAPHPIQLDYFYGGEHEKYKFYRIPAVLLRDERFSSLPLGAVVLYGLLLDRTELSTKNGWRDRLGRIYIKFRQAEAMELLKVGKNSIIKLFNALEEIGLIERRRVGFGESDVIYVKNFATLLEEEAKVMRTAAEGLPSPDPGGSSEPAADEAGGGNETRESKGTGGDFEETSQRFKNQTTDGLENKPQKFESQTSVGLETGVQEVTDVNFNNNYTNKTNPTLSTPIERPDRAEGVIEKLEEQIGFRDILSSERPRIYKLIAQEVFDTLCNILKNGEASGVGPIEHLDGNGFDKLVQLTMRLGGTEDMESFIIEQLPGLSVRRMTPEECRSRVMEQIDAEWFMEAYRSTSLSERPSGSPEQLNMMIELIVETVCSDTQVYHIGGVTVPKSLVVERLMSLNSEHLIYVMDCMEKNPVEIRNIKAYTLTVLYNAPLTMDSYYANQVRRDLYGE